MVWVQVKITCGVGTEARAGVDLGEGILTGNALLLVCSETRGGYFLCNN